MEEPDLVERARNGDAGVYTELVRRYQEIAFRTAYLVTGDPSEAEDAAQEAFIKAFYALDRFRKDAPFRPWLLRIVTNEARNRQLSAQRRARLRLTVAGARPPGGAAPSPEVAALEQEQHQELVDGLAALDERDRIVIVYRYFVEMTEAEMAIALDCPAGTVKSRLSRALQRLRKHILANQAAARSEPESGHRRGVQGG